MKRKTKAIVSILLTTAMLFITGCAQQPASNDSAEVETLKKQIEALESENKELKEQLGSMPESTPSEAVPSESENEQQGTPLNVGDTITTDYAEITINKVELTYDVLPDDTSGFYTHYAAEAGSVYLHIDADIKNLGKQNLPCDDLALVTADYNGGYTYSGFAVPEDSTTGFTYANITSIKPLETMGVHFLFNCPQEVAESSNPLFITFEPSNSTDSYIITVR